MAHKFGCLNDCDGLGDPLSDTFYYNISGHKIHLGIVNEHNTKSIC